MVCSHQGSTVGVGVEDGGGVEVDVGETVTKGVGDRVGELGISASVDGFIFSPTADGLPSCAGAFCEVSTSFDVPEQALTRRKTSRSTKYIRFIMYPLQE